MSADAMERRSDTDKRVQKRKLKRMAFGDKRQRRDAWRSGAAARTDLKHGTMGFLFTHNNNERPAIREAFQILDEYAEKFKLALEVDAEQAEQHDASKWAAADEEPTGATGAGEADDSDEDVSVQLQRECDNLRQAAAAPARGDDALFKQRKCATSNCIFIEMSPRCSMGPSEFCHRIMLDMHDNKRYCEPCPSKNSHFKRAPDSTSGPSYAVDFKSRNQNTIHRYDVISLCADIARCVNVFSKVDLSKPDVTIVVETLSGNVCCAAVVKGFAKLKRYSLHVDFGDSSGDKKGV